MSEHTHSGTTPASTPRDFDNDRHYVKRAGWKTAKAAFGNEHRIKELFRRLEQVGDPRWHLAAAVHHFLTLSEPERQAAKAAHFEWWATELDFAAAMKNIFGEDAR